VSPGKGMVGQQVVTRVPGAERLFLTPGQLPLRLDQVKRILPAHARHRRGVLSNRPAGGNAQVGWWIGAWPLGKRVLRQTPLSPLLASVGTDWLSHYAEPHRHIRSADIRDEPFQPRHDVRVRRNELAQTEGRFRLALHEGLVGSSETNPRFEEEPPRFCLKIELQGGGVIQREQSPFQIEFQPGLVGRHSVQESLDSLRRNGGLEIG